MDAHMFKNEPRTYILLMISHAIVPTIVIMNFTLLLYIMTATNMHPTHNECPGDAPPAYKDAVADDKSLDLRSDTILEHLPGFHNIKKCFHHFLKKFLYLKQQKI